MDRDELALLMSARSYELDLIRALRRRPAWQADAVCADYPPRWWHPERGEPTEPAKRLCAVCSVRSECLAFALDHDERNGIWGGTSPQERRRLRRDRAA